MRTMQELTSQLQDAIAHSEPVPGSMLLIVERVGLFYVEGATVTNEHKAADCTLWVSHDDFEAWLNGQISTDEALMSGQLGIRGDIGVAAAAQHAFTHAWASRGQ